jgi:cell division protein FtsL
MMLWRLLHIVVLAALVLAAADVYKIKYESTLEAERVAKLRGELRREQDAIANLRAEWSKLDRPDRLQELAQRHLTLKPVDARQFDTLDKLPERPAELVPPGTADPIGAVIETLADPEALTGSVPGSSEAKPR